MTVAGTLNPVAGTGRKTDGRRVPNSLTSLDDLLDELRITGLLLLSDLRLPSVVAVVAGGAVRGSWWGHPKAHAIYGLVQGLETHPDVTATRLVSSKVTYVHRRLWASLLAVATANEPWQRTGLTPDAAGLVALVRDAGRVRSDNLATTLARPAKALRNAAREAESRLLLRGDETHTARGTHAKLLESWDHWAKRMKVTGPTIGAATAREHFEGIVADLILKYHASARLPWRRP